MNIINENINKNQNTVTFKNIWEYGVNEQYAIAVWRLPRQKSVHFLADFSGDPRNVKIAFEAADSGFCFSPFLNQQGEKTLLLKNDFHIEFNHFHNIADDLELGVSDKLFLEKAAKNTMMTAKNNEPNKNYFLDKNSKELFKNIVEKAKEEIIKESFQKVVLSRQKIVKINRNFSLPDALKKLCELYPNAFVSAVYIPKTNSIWLGASPELLVSYDEDGIFKTMALAGTQAAFEKDGTKIQTTEARWSQKEIEEQAFVCRYIIECFKKVRVREFIENGPKTIEAGNLLHLQTIYSVDTKAIDFQQFASVLLSLLHPTSAVCGMPHQPALDYILSNENYDRAFYSGFLGPLNINKASNLFVNLRSLKIVENLAFLYAGAGITEDSDPEKEWNETEMKIETLLNIINGSF